MKAFHTQVASIYKLISDQDSVAVFVKLLYLLPRINLPTCSGHYSRRSTLLYCRLQSRIAVEYYNVKEDACEVSAQHSLFGH
jgi:hypothetical protein